MSIFTRKPRIRQAPPIETNPVLMRFLTHGGAIVTLTSSDDRYHANCLGCDWKYGGGIYADNARDKANAHADECRSMPKPGVAR